MYIPPFTLGVLVTVLVEVGICVAGSIISTISKSIKAKKEDKNNDTN